MARCEDYPCCGHVGDEGPCPDFDPDTGEQLNMKCTCGAVLPITARYSICDGCIRRSRIEDGDDYDYEPDDYSDELEDEDEDEDERDLYDY